MDRTSEPQEPSAVDRQRSFASLARAEARRTWGRRPVIWIAATIALLLACGVVPTLGHDYVLTSQIKMVGSEMEARLGDPLFVLLCALTCWPFAILGADLLSLGYRDNPDPLREWSPGEILARSLGRLIPYLMVIGTALVLFTGRALAVGFDLHASKTGSMVLDPDSAAQFPAWWLAWVTVFLASGAPYFAMAALLSATARRPRRWLIAPCVVVIGSLLLSGAACLLARDPDNAFWDHDTGRWFPGPLLLMPNFWVGFYSSAAIHSTFQAGLMRIGVPEELDMGWICWLAVVAFAAYTLPTGLATWAIALRRWRRWGGRRAPDRAPLAQAEPLQAAP